MNIDSRTRLWWTFLRSVSMVNIGLWGWVLATVDFTLPYRTAHVALAGVYTFVCAFRSFYPRIDLERTVMVDHWLSNIVLGRSAATVAEMCFTVQLSLVLFELAPTVPWLTQIGWVIIPIIAIAQITCWAGVLTGNHLWHALEESLWSATVLLMAVAGFGLWSSAEGLMVTLLVAGWLGCGVSMFVMSGIDVPMYIRRWRSEQAAGATYRSFSGGFGDAWRRREPTGAWSVWRHEVAWMTPYFSAGVWLSIFLARFSP